MIVHWTDAAVGHLAAIHEYIAQDSPRHAQGIVDRITRRSEQIALFPLIGGVVPDFHDAAIREIIITPYRIIYRIAIDQIDILAVLHGARRLPPSL